MVEEKDLPSAVADCIGHCVQLSGRGELLDNLTTDPKLMSVKYAAVVLEVMKQQLPAVWSAGEVEGGGKGEGGGRNGGGREGGEREGGRYM